MLFNGFEEHLFASASVCNILSRTCLNVIRSLEHRWRHLFFNRTFDSFQTYFITNILRYSLDGATAFLQSYHWSEFEKLSLAQEAFLFRLLVISTSYFILRATTEIARNADFIFLFFIVSIFSMCTTEQSCVLLT